MKHLAIAAAVLFSVSMASAKISIECGTGMGNNGRFEQSVFTVAAENWIEGKSGRDFYLEVDGEEVSSAQAKINGQNSVTITKEMGFGTNYVLEIDAWEGNSTTGRMKSLGIGAKGTQELECVVLEVK